MGDDEDRKYLMGLTEKQREEILLERYNRRKELQGRWEMKKRLKATSGASTSTSASSASTSPRRVPKRNKTTDTTKASAFSDLKKKRAKALYDDDDDDFDEDDQLDSQDENERDSDEDFVVGEENEKRSSSRSKKGTKGEVMSITVGPDSISTSSTTTSTTGGGGWGDSDNEEENLEKPAKLENIIEICLSRDYLEKNLDNIHFDEFVKDFFVRVGIGKNNDKLVYRLAQIVGVKESPKKYIVGKKTTTKLLILQHGTSTKSFSIEHVSNKPPTSTEFNRWFSESEKHDVSIPTRKQVKDKLAVKEALNNYIYTEDDIKKIVAKNKLNNKMPVNVAAERLSLITFREAAQDINNTEEVERLTAKIQELDKIALAQKKALENEKIIAINEKNKLTNQTQKYDSSANAAVSENDPFSRRHTKPSFPIFIKNQQTEENNNNSSNVSKEGETSSKPEVKKEENKKKEVDPSLLLKSAHDFELDLSSVSGENSTASKSSAPVNANVAQNKRPTLSVNDYKVRRGLV